MIEKAGVTFITDNPLKWKIAFLSLECRGGKNNSSSLMLSREEGWRCFNDKEETDMCLSSLISCRETIYKVWKHMGSVEHDLSILRFD